MKKYILLIGIILYPSLLWGQVDYKEEKTKINTIKRDKNYVYGEGFAETLDEALEAAEQSLRSAILGVISEEESLQDAETVLVNAVKRNSSQIQLKRGTMERVFLYVAKKNILASEEVIAIHRPPALEAEPEISEEILWVEPDNNEVIVSEEFDSQLAEVDVASPILKQMIRLEDVNSIQNFLKKQKEEHSVMWGNVAADINPSWYIIAYTGNEVKAIFDKGLTTRLNFLTGERESLGKYSQYKKIWFMIYE